MKNFIYKNDLPDNFKLENSIAIDTETMGLNITRDRLCLAQISTGNGEAHIIQFEKNNYLAPNFKKILTNPDILKIFHFARFDLATLKHHLGVNINNIYCTKIASRLCRTYTDSHGLKSICEELLGVEISKKQQSSDWGQAEINSKQLEYAGSDVIYLHALKEKLNSMLIRENRLEIYNSCINFLPSRVDLDLIGFANLDIFSH
jgi:ribonuclease D